MADENSSGEPLDLSLWLDLDPLTIRQAACLWAGLPADGVSQSIFGRYPERVQAARDWVNKMAKAAQAVPPLLSCEQPIPTRPGEQLTRRSVRSSYLGGGYQPARHAPDVTDWAAALVSRAELRRYAESIGQRPAFLFPEAAGVVRGAADSWGAEPGVKWARGVRRVAWDAAKTILAGGAALTAFGLEKGMRDSGKVEKKGNEYHLKSTDGNLTDREMTVKPATIAGWVTELKKLL